MKKIVSENKKKQAKITADLIAEYVRRKPNALLCLAAGDTPTETYAEMADMQKQGLVNFRGCRLIGLDEWVGLDECSEGGCKNYILEHVIKPLELREENIFFFDACAENLELECQRANEYLEKEGPIDLSLMGVGMNGHIALNEPGCDFSGTAHVVQLDSVTVAVAQKYFPNHRAITQGITLGMKQIWDSNLLIIIANEAKKKNIMYSAMYGEVTNNIPASALQRHSNCIVSVDMEADSMGKVELKGENLFIDGQPFLVRGAEIQYFRLEPKSWRAVLENAKKTGINLITTYIPWFFHEEEEGLVDLEGRTNPAKNLRHFFELACEMGFYIAARPGPFINSELRDGGFPRWLFEKYPETLSRNATGDYCLGRPCPAEGEPVYREKVYNWYKAVIPLIAEFQDREKGGVILFQPDNELSSAWSFGLLNSLYDPTILTVYWPEYLKGYYKKIETLNGHYGSSYFDFSDVKPPRKFPSSVSEKKLAVDWMNFKRRFFADWGIELVRYAMELGIHVPSTLNEPVAGFFNHGDHSGVGARLKESKLPIFTSCHTYSDRLQDWDGCADNAMSVRLNRSSPLNSVTLAMEAGAGCYNQRLRKSDINWDMLLRNNLIDGLAGSVIYSYINGNAPLSETIEGPEYWPLAPLSAKGETNRLTEKICQFHHFVEAWEEEIALAHCPEELNLAFSAGMRISDFLGLYPLMGKNTQTSPGGEKFNAEPKIDRGEVSVSHDWLDGYEGVSKQTVQLESSAWRKVREALVLAVRLGLSGRMIDLSNPCCPASSNTPLLVPNAGCLEAEAFDYLCEYIKNGGKVIFTPMIPQFDLYGNRNDSLLQLLGAELSQMIRPAGGKVLDYGSRVVSTAYNQTLSVHSWICVYEFSKKSKALAFYQDKATAVSLETGKGKAVVVGFEAVYNNAQSAAFWRNIFAEECGILPSAQEKQGYFSLFSRKKEDMHFLAVGNAAGTWEPGTIQCEGYEFTLELMPHEGRILTFNVPVLKGENKICYSTSEIIPLDSERSKFELHGFPGTKGKIVFSKPGIIELNGRQVPLKQEKDGFALLYEHSKRPCTISIK